MTIPSPDDLIDLDEVMAKTGLSSSTIYKWMAEERFPLGVQLTPKCVRWVRGEVDEHNRQAAVQRITLRAPAPRGEDAGALPQPANPPVQRRGRGRPRKAA